MTRVYVADAKLEERSALRLLLLDLKMEVVGKAADWATTLAQAPIRRTDMLIDWDLLPNSPIAALDELRQACPAATGHYSHQPSGRLSAYLTACISRRRAFVLSDAAWLNEGLKIRRTNAVPSASAKSDSFFK